MTPERRPAPGAGPVSVERAHAVTLVVHLSADPDAAGGVGPAAGGADASADATDAADPDPGEPPGEPPGGGGWLPDEAFVAGWARRAIDAVLADPQGRDARLSAPGPLTVELSVHFAGASESRALNRDHRNRDRPTNVLSFPSGLPALATPAGEGGATFVALGDLVPCPELIRREAREQGKDERAHWAHLVVHGTLHLLGLDHEDEVSAVSMEAVETGLLSAGGWPDPYRAMPDEAGR